MYDRIPPELRSYRQWVLWRFEQRNDGKPTKPLINPYTGGYASVSDPSTWATYDEALRMVRMRGEHGLGFVFTSDDPFTGIDLDAIEPSNPDHELIVKRQIKVAESFGSYQEISPSGKGLHIIVKGTVPEGRRRAGIEVYPHSRFFTMTGNVYRDEPIAERQGLLTLLFGEMDETRQDIYIGDLTEKHTDEQIYTMAANAANGALFVDLWHGKWEAYYGDRSQSEADQALVNIIAFYTQHRMQIARLFRMSALGQRQKAQRADYVGKMISKGFDKLVPPVNLEAVKASVDAVLKRNDAASGDTNGADPANVEGTDRSGREEPATQALVVNGHAVNKDMRSAPVLWPHGLVGRIAQHILDASPRPLPEVASAAAFGLMAGICGQAYNHGRLGLNLYLLLAAPPGSGKESAHSGINSLMYAARGAMNDGGEFSFSAATHFIGPSRVSSGQALIRHLSNPDHTAFASIFGEFGFRLRQMAAPNASSADSSLQQVLLDVYNKSGLDGVLGAVSYADKDKDIAAIRRPSVTIIGESTPKEFYGAISERLVMNGLLPRFVSFISRRKRPPHNDGYEHVKPPADLVTAIQQMVANALNMRRTNQAIPISEAPDAAAELRRINEFCDAQINRDSASEIEQALWARAYVNVLKISSLLAVGQNLYEPTISLADVDYAGRIVIAGVTDLIGRFEAGEVEGIEMGEMDSGQRRAIIGAIQKYMTSDYDGVKSYNVRRKMHDAKVFTAQYIQRRLHTNAPFRQDRRGATTAINSMLAHMVSEGVLREVSRHQAETEFGFTGRCYVVADASAVLRD